MPRTPSSRTALGWERRHNPPHPVLRCPHFCCPGPAWPRSGETADKGAGWECVCVRSSGCHVYRAPCPLWSAALFKQMLVRPGLQLAYGPPPSHSACSGDLWALSARCRMSRQLFRGILKEHGAHSGLGKGLTTMKWLVLGGPRSGRGRPVK